MNANRPPVVFIPGQLCNERLWTAERAAVGALAPVSVAVQRDHDSVGGLAHAVLADAPETFSIVSHGMGGFVAFEILRQAPSRVASVVLMSTLAQNDTPAQTARREGYLRLVEAGQFAQVVEERLPILFRPESAKDAQLVGVARLMAEETGPETFLRQQRAIMSRPDSRPDLPRMSCPVLLLYARQDGIATLKHQQDMLAGFPDARLEIIEDCGHLMTLERPEATSRIVADWIVAT
jgi:pimeloyl-ACP methyl ester carboxylesterase